MSYKNSYNGENYRAKRAWMFEQLGNECSVCGTGENLKLVYKQLPRPTSFHICRNWSASKERLRDELKLCTLLCSTHYGESKIKATSEKEPRYKNFDIFDTEEL